MCRAGLVAACDMRSVVQRECRFRKVNSQSRWLYSRLADESLNEVVAECGIDSLASPVSSDKPRQVTLPVYLQVTGKAKLSEFAAQRRGKMTLPFFFFLIH